MELSKSLFWIGHASFYLKGDGYNIFIDPFRVSPGIKEKADLILITHAHMDHCSKDDIRRVLKPDGEIMCSKGCFNDDDFKNFSVMEPGSKSEFSGVNITAVPAYNTNPARLAAHPKANKWVGYVLDADGFSIYHAGDTDFIDEMKALKGIGAALLPMGGTYVMDSEDAINASNAIGAEFSVPMHYKALLGKDGSEAAEAKFRAHAHNPLIMKEVQEPAYGFS